MYTQRINELFELINADKLRFANDIGCAVINFQKILEGERVPKQNGFLYKRITRSLIRFAEANGKKDDLCTAIGVETTSSNYKIEQAINQYLYEGIIVPKRITQMEKTSKGHFNTRLNMAIKMAEISNIDFGKALGVDASYISRLKAGSRFPKNSAPLYDSICRILLEGIYKNDNIGELSEKIGIPAETFDDRDNGFIAFRSWLFDIGSSRSDSVDSFLRRLGMFYGESETEVKALDDIIDMSILEDKTKTYVGDEGLRSAVLRFLGNVALKKCKELYLFSNQNMSWMAKNEKFARQWLDLMLLCASEGTKISIIHNIERPMKELNEAIEMWMPLYQTGMVQPYYIKGQGAPSFSTTLFVCPSYAAVTGANVANVESENGIYYYSVDPDIVDRKARSFKGLIDKTEKFIDMLDTPFIDDVEGFERGELVTLESTLPLASMPDDVFESALARANVSKDEKDRFRSIRMARIERIENAKKGKTEECLFIASRKDAASGQVRMDLPGLDLRYTEDEYVKHIESIINILSTMPSYDLYPLRDSDFRNIKLMIGENLCAISVNKKPYVTIVIKQPGLVAAFKDYYDTVRKQLGFDREKIIGILKDAIE